MTEDTYVVSFRTLLYIYKVGGLEGWLKLLTDTNPVDS